MTDNVYLCIYACDYAAGSKIESGPETIARIEKGLDFMEAHPQHHFILLLGAGRKSEKKPSYPLKFAMKKYIEKRIQEKMMHSGLYEAPHLEIRCAEENIWGSFRETEGMLRMMEHATEYSVAVVTSSYHMPRIRFIWKLLTNIRIIEQPVGVDRGMRTALFERIKRLKVLYLFRFNKATLH